MSLLEAMVKHLPHYHSDHCPLLLQTNPTSSNGLGKRPFRFQTAWLAYKDFGKVVNELWRENMSLVDSLQRLDFGLQSWNKDSFGNIFQRKRLLIRRLMGVQ